MKSRAEGIAKIVAEREEAEAASRSGLWARDPVRIHGLSGRPELNGMTGMLTSWVPEKERWGVQVWVPALPNDSTGAAAAAVEAATAAAGAEGAVAEAAAATEAEAAVEVEAAAAVVAAAAAIAKLNVNAHAFTPRSNAASAPPVSVPSGAKTPTTAAKPDADLGGRLEELAVRPANLEPIPDVRVRATAPDADFASLQDAVDAATFGMRIVVSGFTGTGTDTDTDDTALQDAVITRAVQIKGEGPTLANGRPTNNSGALVRSLKLRCTAGAGTAYIDELCFTRGIVVEHGEVVLQHCTIHNLASHQGAGVFICNGAVTMRQCKVSHCDDGVLCQNGALVVDGCLIETCRDDGIFCNGSLTVRDTIIRDVGRNGIKCRFGLVNREGRNNIQGSPWDREPDEALDGDAEEYDDDNDDDDDDDDDDYDDGDYDDYDDDDDKDENECGAFNPGYSDDDTNSEDDDGDDGEYDNVADAAAISPAIAAALAATTSPAHAAARIAASVANEAAGNWRLCS
mmetsp:Transcript_30012/g.74435  ORF Transcript_30012/g.74435 Transcript_30012/m.74435 type:complete len:514 (+) Transcript_30012:1048-2589(+)